jgi:hypothetical protein
MPVVGIFSSTNLISDGPQEDQVRNEWLNLAIACDTICSGRRNNVQRNNVQRSHSSAFQWIPVMGLRSVLLILELANT